MCVYRERVYQVTAAEHMRLVNTKVNMGMWLLQAKRMLSPS